MIVKITLLNLFTKIKNIRPGLFIISYVLWGGINFFYIGYITHPLWILNIIVSIHNILLISTGCSIFYHNELPTGTKSITGIPAKIAGVCIVLLGLYAFFIQVV